MESVTFHDRDATDLKAGCDQEPVHVPGSIQPHGVLLVLDREREEILQVAGDVRSLLGFSGRVQGRELAEILGTTLANLMCNSDTTLLREPTYVGTIDRPAGAGPLTVTAHLVDDVVVVELEHAAATRSAPSLLAVIRSIRGRIGDASSLLEAAKIAVDEVRAITGYDRVMVYRFLADDSGSVIAETHAQDMSPFLHHRFPASDIPPPARALYRRSPIRVIPDVGYVAAPLVPVSLPNTGGLFDMSHCALRSVSPVHIKYLKNMGVDASMSVSLLLQGELWGLIACHNKTLSPVPYEARELCIHVAQILAQKIQALSEADAHRLSRDLDSAADRLLREFLDTDDPASILFARCSSLQELIHSGGVAISWKESVATAGNVPMPDDVASLARWLRTHLLGGDTLSSHRLSEQYPQAAEFGREGSG